jgi:hypothetical protein
MKTKKKNFLAGIEKTSKGFKLICLQRWAAKSDRKGKFEELVRASNFDFKVLKNLIEEISVL